MHAWEAIQNAIDFIEDNLSEDIKIEALACAAALSPYYFQRLFKRLVKKTVNEYIKLRRLAKASEALKDTETRIAIIALEYGFSDHAGFTRAFKAAYGITPETFRNNPVILNHFIKPDLSLRHILADENMPFITDGILIEVSVRKLKADRFFIGIQEEVPTKELGSGRITGIAAAGRLWDAFHSMKAGITNLLPDGNEFGLVNKGNGGIESCNYMAGGEAFNNGEIQGYTSFNMPGGDYAVCRFEAESFNDLISTAVFKASSFMKGWLREKGLICGDFAAEIYDTPGPHGASMELWLPLIPTMETKPLVKWDKEDGSQKPLPEVMDSYVSSNLWNKLRHYIEVNYDVKPLMEYSGCSMQKGWNLKYKKAGRSLCTLYPMEGYFFALLVIGERERAETELAMPGFSEYFKKLYSETKAGMGQKWLMINVLSDEVLEDIKKCIAIRRSGKIR